MAKNITYYDVQLVKEKGARVEMGNITKVDGQRSAYKALENIFQLSSKPQEHFVLLTLDVKLNVTGAFTVHIGTTNMSIASTKDVFQRALLANASAIIVGHNHPSGNPAPSPEDIEITKTIAEVGKLLKIELIDHIIIGDGSYISLAEKGYI